jgi:hypothetical protein
MESTGDNDEKSLRRAELLQPAFSAGVFRQLWPHGKKHYGWHKTICAIAAGKSGRK